MYSESFKHLQQKPRIMSLVYQKLLISYILPAPCILQDFYFSPNGIPLNKLPDFNPRANYTDRATAACRRI
jgi:hypothetical protein